MSNTASSAATHSPSTNRRNRKPVYSRRMLSLYDSVRAGLSLSVNANERQSGSSPILNRFRRLGVAADGDAGVVVGEHVVAVGEGGINGETGRPAIGVGPAVEGGQAR